MQIRPFTGSEQAALAAIMQATAARAPSPYSTLPADARHLAATALHYLIGCTPDHSGDFDLIGFTSPNLRAALRSACDYHDCNAGERLAVHSVIVSVPGVIDVHAVPNNVITECISTATLPAYAATSDDYPVSY